MTLSKEKMNRKCETKENELTFKARRIRRYRSSSVRLVLAAAGVGLRLQNLVFFLGLKRQKRR
ncbi:hypothetical protein L484_018136 [Morus notabilis]|uniref:Uncharacterized protein n=1 Tax=Morus notabilis TaxID=981085 RepID=W9R5X0_9ROSA|nr:hypothetical protein L484_018136 [Morus notabilis]